MKMTGNTILMTGGGTGIGRALAHRFHDLGNEVIVTGRRRAPLDETIAGRERMHAELLDVADPEAIRDFARHIAATHSNLNILINNAGIMPLENAGAPRNLHDAEAVITTNILGPIRLSDALLDHLVAQPDSAIVNVTSGLAFVPTKRAPTYSATKAAMHSYTLTLREALKGRVEVIELAPPGVQTDLTPGQASNAAYQPLDDYADEVMRLFAQVPTPPEILVERVKPLRFAERDGTFAEKLALLNPA
ncbi:MAG: SDR family oxidoreductase [Pseudomonadota bacterium]|nr:SDR family oxidoreductase [Pseudomonadota bacterium]